MIKNYLFISITNEKKAKTIPTMMTVFKNLIIQMIIRLLMDMFSSKNNKTNHVCCNNLGDFLGLCDPPNFELDNISEANSQNSFEIGVVEDKENIEISQLLMLLMIISKLYLKLFTVAEMMNLLYQEVVYFVKLRIYYF